ncbi:Bacterial Ig-like domain (group 1) [Corynebacterium felinum]|uniref:hypothetical protein n=1 Tax=Corynebacterium felinum TaxID=131318 RepID=UPI0025B3538D|nr:hypothetical protein [Corynebacterium felinum]WJY95771.1 Bacterial Ig-like domain (group 1) [Corynebacterium felinum]
MMKNHTFFVLPRRGRGQKKNTLTKSIATVVVPTLAASALAVVAAPQAAAVPQSFDLQFKCSISVNSSGFVTQANGVHAIDAFRFKLKVEAPKAVEKGQKFDYVLKPGFVGLPNPFSASGATVIMNSMEQAKLTMDLPQNAEIHETTIEGHSAGVQLFKDSDTRVRLSGETITDDMDTNNPSTIKKKDVKGMTGQQRGNRMGFDLPDVRISMTATQEGEIQPSFPLVTNHTDRHYPANESFFSMLGDVTAQAPIVGNLNTLALVRCTPVNFAGMPKVKVIDASKVSGKTTELKFSANPNPGRAEEPAAITVTAVDANGTPQPQEPVILEVNGRRELFVSDAKGQIDYTFTPEQPGTVSFKASVGEVSATYDYQVTTANPDVVTPLNIPFLCMATPDTTQPAENPNPEAPVLLNTHVAGVHGDTARAKTNPGFMLNMDVVAPESVRVGDEFTYSLRPKELVGASGYQRNSFITVTNTEISQARLRLRAPENAQLVAAEKAGIGEGQATLDSGNILMRKDTDSDSVDPADLASITAAATGGLSAQVDEDKLSVKFPWIDLKMKATEEGLVRAQLPQAADINANKAEDSFITFIAHYKVASSENDKFKAEAKTLMRCAPAGEQQLPAVAVKSRMSQLSIDGPAKVKVGEETTYTVQVGDTANQPVADAVVTLRIGDAEYKERTSDKGTATFTFTPETEGDVVMVAKVGGLTAQKTVNVWAPVPPEPPKPSLSSIISEAVPSYVWKIIAGVVGALALAIGGFFAAVRAGAVPAPQVPGSSTGRR